MDMCKLRNTHPAFNGSFEVLDAVVDIQQYADELRAAQPAATSAYLTDRLGMPAEVAQAPAGGDWYAPPNNSHRRRPPNALAPASEPVLCPPRLAPARTAGLTRVRGLRGTSGGATLLLSRRH